MRKMFSLFLRTRLKFFTKIKNCFDFITCLDKMQVFYLVFLKISVFFLPGSLSHSVNTMVSDQ